jgi:hypothetical protein
VSLPDPQLQVNPSAKETFNAVSLSVGIPSTPVALANRHSKELPSRAMDRHGRRVGQSDNIGAASSGNHRSAEPLYSASR